MHVEVPLSTGGVTLIDEADLQREFTYQFRDGCTAPVVISESTWRLSYDSIRSKKGRRGSYVVTTKTAEGRSRTVRLHRLILGASAEMCVDHANGNVLDNRRSNIRLCSRLENSRNTARKCGLSQFKGVSPRGDRYRAQIKLHGRLTILGYFATEEGAARAYDAAALEHFGQFARVNFSDGVATVS